MKIKSLFPYVTEEHRQIDHTITLLEKAIAHLKCGVFSTPNLDAAFQYITLAKEHLGMIHLVQKKGRS